jgi:beta-lactamase class A
MPCLHVLLMLIVAAACSTAGLLQEIRSIALPAGGHVGAAIVLVESGKIVSWNGNQHFPMQSVYKLPIAIAILQLVDSGRLRLDQRVRLEERDLPPASVHSPMRDQHPQGGVEFSIHELLRAVIVESDGAASDLLLGLVGPKIVTGFMNSLGAKDLVVATSETEMARNEEVQYRNWASPEATVVLLSNLQKGRGLSAPSRQMLLAWMTETPTGPQRIKGILPAGTRVAHKTGTSATVQGMTRATNDAGIITLPDGRHLAVAVFVSDSIADLSTREGAIAKIARAAWDCYTSMQK